MTERADEKLTEEEYQTMKRRLDGQVWQAENEPLTQNDLDFYHESEDFTDYLNNHPEIDFRDALDRRRVIALKRVIRVERDIAKIKKHLKLP